MMPGSSPQILYVPVLILAKRKQRHGERGVIFFLFCFVGGGGGWPFSAPDEKYLFLARCLSYGI